MKNTKGNKEKLCSMFWKDFFLLVCFKSQRRCGPKRQTFLFPSNPANELLKSSVIWKPESISSTTARHQSPRSEWAAFLIWQAEKKWKRNFCARLIHYHSEETLAYSLAFFLFRRHRKAQQGQTQQKHQQKRIFEDLKSEWSRHSRGFCVLLYDYPRRVKETK